MSEKKMIATRDGFGKEIVELGKEDSNLVVVDIDIGKSCKTGEFRKQLPEQYINVGIAEQNGAGFAAGLATCGKVPFVVTYAVFGSLRMCEMIRQEICYTNLNVKIACSHGGVTPANDGASHQSIEDMGVLRTIPNMTVIMPADYNSARKLVRQAAKTYGPMYLRFTRDAVPQIYGEDVEFTIGKAHQIQDGKDVAIIANGDTAEVTWVGRTEKMYGRYFVGASGCGCRRGACQRRYLRPGAGYAHHQAPGYCGCHRRHQRHWQDHHGRGPQHHQRPGLRRLRGCRRDGQGPGQARGHSGPVRPVRPL